MKTYLFVMLGGATGAALRFALSRMNVAGDWPWSTFATNIIGGLAMGVLAIWVAKAGLAGEPMRLLLGVGLLGGFTTFSAFSLEMMQMVERGSADLAAAYALASVLLALAAVFAGATIGRMIWP